MIRRTSAATFLPVSSHIPLCPYSEYYTVDIYTPPLTYPLATRGSLRDPPFASSSLCLVGVQEAPRTDRYTTDCTTVSCRCICTLIARSTQPSQMFTSESRSDICWQKKTRCVNLCFPVPGISYAPIKQVQRAKHPLHQPVLSYGGLVPGICDSGSEQYCAEGDMNA